MNCFKFFLWFLKTSYSRHVLKMTFGISLSNELANECCTISNNFARHSGLGAVGKGLTSEGAIA